MKISFKLFASLSEFLPAGALDNQIEIDVPADATPAWVISHYKVPRELAHLVLIDGFYVSPDERNTRVLKEHEVLAVFPPVAGGRD
ncbi:MAG: MoaD/ThiS family protein [Gammaproteobacteria bacterium]|nr:MoaD/ThiS family protein [Gammaproteobacteria bacterium]